MAADVLYAYAVARDADGLDTAVEGLRGVAGAAVRLVRDPDGGLAAAASTVPAGDFDEEGLPRHLEDLAWLEAVARAHHTVVAALAAATTVLPLRLATVYRDEERLADVLRAGRPAFTERLARLDGRSEWGVKVHVLPGQEGNGPEAPPPDPAAGPGRAYLLRRRAARDHRTEAYRAAELAAARIEEAARGIAVDRVGHRPQSGQLAAGPGENVVNDAYLLPRESADAFRAAVLAAADGLPGISVEVTGPWAPYSFAAPPDDDAGGPAT